MKKLLVFLFVMMAFVACTKGDSDDVGGGSSNNNHPKVPEITLDATEVNFTAEGGSTIVTFASSDDWIAETINNRADVWCCVSPTSGSVGNSKITITVTSNDTVDDRTATVVLKSGTTQKTITVSQKRKYALTVTSSKFEVSADGGEVEIEVKANIDFNVEVEESAKSWVTHRSTRAMKSSTLILDVDENDGVEKRRANISISGNGLKETVTIYQEGFKPSIVLTQNEYTVPSAGETIAVEVKSNVDVTIEMPNAADWISENVTRAISTNTYYFDIASNDGYDARKAEIKVINKDNNLSETITINQSQKDAIVIANDNYEVKDTGGVIEIEVGYNIEFDITIDGDWITQQQTRALETIKLAFAVAENLTDKVREGSITFTSKDGTISQKIYVTQNAPTCEITYTTSTGKIVTPYKADVFGAKIVSNTYENDKGVIVFDGKITSIGNIAFYNCSSLTSVTIPESVTSIGESAFMSCKSLERITIPDSVTSIGERAFAGCESLTGVTIPESVTSIGNGTFASCKSLKSFYGKYASVDNRCLIIDGVLHSFAPAEITIYAIPNSVTSIGNSAFDGCSSLTSVTIPNSVTSIGNSAFFGCSSLTSVTIPESVTSIGITAFRDCSNLTSITIPNSVTSIENQAFCACNSLTSVTIGNSVTSIGKDAFWACGNLTSIVIPDSVISIGDSAFGMCDNLTSVIIGNNVTSIGRQAFYYCYNMQSVYCKPTTPPTLGKTNYMIGGEVVDVFYSSKLTIYVPTTSLSSYKSNTYWREYAAAIKGYNFDSSIDDEK